MNKIDNSPDFSANFTNITSPILYSNNSRFIKRYLMLDLHGTLLYQNIFDNEQTTNYPIKFEEIDSEPNLYDIFIEIKSKNLSFFSFETVLISKQENKVNNYQVSVNSIQVGDQKYFVFAFEEMKIFDEIEDKINTFQNALELGNIPTLIADDNLLITYITKSFEDLLNQNIENLFHSDFTVALKKWLNDEDEIVLASSIENKTTWSKIVSINEPREGSKYIEVMLTPTYRASLNKWSYFISAYDITDHVLIGKLALQNEQRMKLIIDNVSDILFVINEINDKFYFVIGNKNFYKLFMKKHSTFFSDKFLDVIDPLLAKIIRELFDNMSEDCEISKSKLYYHSYTDQYFEIKLSQFATLDEDVEHYIVNLKDITQREKYEAQLEASLGKEKELNRLKNIFLHKMSHEIRTPANALLGYSEILKESIEENDFETIKIIGASVNEVIVSLVTHFGNIIELSEIESEESHVIKSEVDVSQQIKKIISIKYQELAEKGLKLYFDVPENKYIIQTDKEKLYKILTNLIDNAIKFTQRGSVAIYNQLTEYELIILIRDTGIGIESDKIPKLLEPFEQEQEFYSRNFQGSGLGLSIAHRLCKILGGALQISSKPNVGTEVRVVLPLN